MRMQRRLRNLDDDNDVVGGKQCAYFSGRRNNEAGYIEDAIIKDAEGCLKELPYTCVLYLPDKVPPREIIDIELEVINVKALDEKYKLEPEITPEEIDQTEYDEFIGVGKYFMTKGKKQVPDKLSLPEELSYKVRFTPPKDEGVRKNLTTEIRIFSNVDSDFEKGRLLTSVRAKDMTSVDLNEEELTECPPNLPIDLKFWIHTQTDEQNMATARLIESLFLDNFHMGIEETNILFDIWTGNASYAPIHYTMAEKYKPRDPKKHKLYNIWIGDKKLNKRWAVLKSEGDPGIQNKTDRRPIKFMVERRIDQSRSMVTTAEDKANDMIGQSKFREIFQELCSEQLFFSRSIRAAARDEDGNLADPSKPSTFIQILRKAQEGHFSRIKVPSAAKQVEIVVEKKKGNTAAIAGGVSGAGVVLIGIIAAVVCSGKMGSGGKDKKKKKGGKGGKKGSKKGGKGKGKK